MSRTRHLHQRMGQRGVTERMLQVVLGFGVCHGDKLTLDRGNIDQLMCAMDKLKKDLLKVRDKGGLVVVEAGGSAITTYRANSFKRDK